MLNWKQRKALLALADEYDEEIEPRIVGWDTSVEGPLVECPTDSLASIFFAISPKGKRVERPRPDREAA